MKPIFPHAICLATVIGLLGPALTASAAQMNLDHVFSSGSVPPGNSITPWLDYSVQSQGGDTILFTLTATGNMTDPEKIKEFYFNFDDSLSVANLSFGPALATGSFTLPTISKSSNGLKADGDGWYDLRLIFDSSGGLANYFDSGDSLSYLLTYTGPGTMTESSFEFLSQPGGGEGTYYAAAHIQSTPAGGTGSAWLGATTITGIPPIPEPATGTLIIVTLAAFGLRRPRN